MAERKKIGELLVEGKVITATQLQSALAHQKQWGGRLGTALIEKGFLTEDVLAKFLSFQLNFPSVNLTKIQVQSDVLARVSREMQEKHLCVPIAVMKEGRTDALILAIADPTDLRAIDEIGFATGLKVKPVVATESALKRFLFGAQTGGVRNVSLATPSGFKTIHEKTDEFEVVRGTTSPGLPGDRVPGVVGEETIDFGSESQELVLEATEVEPEVITGTMPAPAKPAPPKAPPAQAKPAADPFAAALVARASGDAAPMPMPTPTPTVMGTVGPIPGGAPVMEGSLPTLDPGALAPVSLNPSMAGAIPANGFDAADDRTEPDIVMAGGSPPPIEEPAEAPWQPAPDGVSVEAESVDPAPEPSLLDAWEEAPKEIVATGAVPTDDGMPEISLPGPEMLPPPPEILEQPVPSEPNLSPSKIFSIPEDVPLAEASLAVPPEPAWEPEPEKSYTPKPEAWEPAPEAAWEPPAESVAQPEAEAPLGFDPGLESGFEPTIPDGDMAESQPPASLDPPAQMSEEIPQEMPAEIPPEPASEEHAHEPLAADGGGAVPSSLDPMDEQEKTVVGSGAAEPTWSGEISGDVSAETRVPEKTVLGAGAAEPMWSPSETTETAESLPGPKVSAPDRDTTSDRETVESFELPPPKPVPPPAAKLAPPAPVPTPPSQEKTFLKSPASPPPVKVEVAEPPESSEPSRPPIAVAGISEEQAQLNVTITKKLKLLNAIAELLLEKGLITEEEIKEKIAKKK